VNVRTADPAGLDAEQDFLGSGLRLRNFFKEQWMSDPIKPGSFHGFHQIPILPFLIDSL
jgi:hypothetical protein